MRHLVTYKLSKLLLPLLLIIGGKQCYADTVSIPLRYYHSDHLGSASWITNDSGTPVQHLQYMPYGEPFVNERTTGYEERSYSPLLHYHYVSTSLTVQIPNGNAIANLLAFSYSPLLHYHYVSTSLTVQIPTETLSQTRRVCFMLLCYRSVTTALTAQIPMETLSQSHRLCFIGKERDSETGFSYFGARYYDSDLMTGWLSVDPMADKYPGLSPYAYCAWNPVKLVDPDGEATYR